MMNHRRRSSRAAMGHSFDHRKLAAFRRRAGLTLTEMEDLSGIARSSLSDYELGHTVPSVRRIKRICEILRLDLFEVAELLRLRFISRQEMENFRAACAAEGVAPADALRDFIQVYAAAE